MTQDPLTLYKLIVLYMLDKVNFKLTYSQISGFILEKEYTNFLTLQQVISDLQDAELIKTDAMMNRTFFSITEEGQNTLKYFGNRISDTIKQEIDNFLTEKHLELKNEASITANFYKSTSGEYETELIAKEKDIELVNIKLSVPTKDMAETICDSWYNKNQQIYKYLMEELF
jgi:DNA-binding PadR family transcriptional regulator